MSTGGIVATWDDAFLLNGLRTPFVDYNGALAQVSPIDLGIKVGREVIRESGVSAAEIATVICGSVAQASFDAYMLPRHIGLYAGAPLETPAHLVQRVCGTGIEVLSQAADAVSSERAMVALCVGTESHYGLKPLAVGSVCRSGRRTGRHGYRARSGSAGYLGSNQAKTLGYRKVRNKRGVRGAGDRMRARVGPSGGQVEPAVQSRSGIHLLRRLCVWRSRFRANRSFEPSLRNSVGVYRRRASNCDAP